MVSARETSRNPAALSVCVISAADTMKLILASRTGDRIDDGLNFPLHQVVDGESAGTLEHAMDPGVEPLLFGDVHRDVLGPGVVESVRGERQLEGVALDEVNEAGEARPQREPAGDFDKGRCQLDAGDVAAVDGCQVAGGAAEPGADVEDAFAPGEAEALRQFLGCRKAPDVEVVERSQLRPFDRAGPEARFKQGLLDAGGHLSEFVMFLDRSGVIHDHCSKVVPMNGRADQRRHVARHGNKTAARNYGASLVNRSIPSGIWGRHGVGRSRPRREVWRGHGISGRRPTASQR